MLFNQDADINICLEFKCASGCVCDNRTWWFVIDFCISQPIGNTFKVLVDIKKTFYGMFVDPFLYQDKRSILLLLLILQESNICVFAVVPDCRASC
jgi:hypothetical protein